MFGWGLGYFGQPHIITKFIGIKDPNELRKARNLGISWQICVLSGAALVGIIGVKLFAHTQIDPQLVFIEMVKQLFHPFMIGFVLCAIFAATISTMDSQILVCASVISEDLWKRFLHKSASSRQIVVVSRIAVVLVSLIALFLAFNRSATISSVVFYAWSGLGSAFGPLILMSLYSTSANRYGAIAGIFTGGLLVIAWPYLNPMISSYAIPSMLPGFFLGSLAIYAVSNLTKSLPAGIPLAEKNLTL
jgi:sodium/proline symporter